MGRAGPDTSLSKGDRSPPVDIARPPRDKQPAPRKVRMIPFPDMSPTLFEVEIFGLTLALRWYALAYIAGIDLWLVDHPARHPHAAPVERRPAPDGRAGRTVFRPGRSLASSLAGGLGYVLFYDPATYLAEPWKIPCVWEGGMSFHGGFVGVAVAGLWFCRREKIPMLSMGDLLALAVPVGPDAGPAGQFHQRRALGPADHPALGRDLPGRGGADLPAAGGPLRPPPQPALRSRAGGAVAGHCPDLAGLPARVAEAAGRDHGGVPAGLRPGPLRRRIRPPARRAVRQRRQPARPCAARRRLWADHGAAPVAADDRGGPVVCHARQGARPRRR